jgi:mannose-6-phosphate isomerase-like protein (cupin superfamily)
MTEGFAVLPPEAQRWRESNLMKIPNADLLQGLGGSDRLGGRLWRLPPFSANTWHRHVDSWEFYFLLEGTGRMRLGATTVTVARYGSVLVAPAMLRQVFNDTPDESLWLIVASPQEDPSVLKGDLAGIYPEDPKSLPAELAAGTWPPVMPRQG